MNNITYLKKVPLFSGFSHADYRLLQDLGKTVRIAEGKAIFNEDTPGNSLFIVLSGMVKIFTTSGKKKKTLAFIEKGEFFGEMTLLDLQPRSASSVAIEDCELLEIKKKDFNALLLKNPHISLHVLKTLSRRLRHADWEIESLTFGNVLGRVADTLLTFGEKYGHNVAEGQVISKPMSHKEIAEIAGTGREVVTRIINRFRRLEYISYDNKKFTIRRPEKLKDLIY